MLWLPTIIGMLIDDYRQLHLYLIILVTFVTYIKYFETKN